MTGELLQASEHDKVVDGQLRAPLGFQLMRHRSGVCSSVLIELEHSTKTPRSREIPRNPLHLKNEQTTYWAISRSAHRMLFVRVVLCCIGPDGGNYLPLGDGENHAVCYGLGELFLSAMADSDGRSGDR